MARSRPLAAVLIELRPSKILPDEIGLFAARALKKDTIIAHAKRLGERFMPWSAYADVDPLTRRKIRHFCLQTPEGFYLPEDFNYLMVPWNMNHSCDYNVGFDAAGNFVTAKNVRAGDELTWDYGMGISYPKYRLHCRCGSRRCRKLVTGNDWKDPAYRAKNRAYFLRELLRAADTSSRV